MYMIPKENKQVKSLQSISIDLNISQTWKVVRTPGCKPGEYALFLKQDEDKSIKFSKFIGYASYDNICDWFEMINYRARSKS